MSLPPFRKQDSEKLSQSLGHSYLLDSNPAYKGPQSMCSALWLCLSKKCKLILSVKEEKNQRPEISEALVPFQPNLGGLGECGGGSDTSSAFQEHLQRAGLLTTSTARQTEVRSTVAPAMSSSQAAGTDFQGVHLEHHNVESRGGMGELSPSPALLKAKTAPSRVRTKPPHAAQHSGLGHHSTSIPHAPRRGSRSKAWVHSWAPSAEATERQRLASDRPSAPWATRGRLHAAPLPAAGTSSEPSSSTGTSDEHEGHPLVSCVATQFGGSYSESSIQVYVHLTLHSAAANQNQSGIIDGIIRILTASQETNLASVSFFSVCLISRSMHEYIHACMFPSVHVCA